MSDDFRPENIAWLVLLLPLLAAVAITLFTRRDGKFSSQISIAAVVLSFLVSCGLFLMFRESSLVNPGAMATADSLDKRFAREGLTGPLHCIPTIVKDNFLTYDLPTSAGSLALKDWRPTHDAFLVKRVRAAGAIVLAKSNMAELAFSPNETVSSVLPGYSRNPYALDRVTAGSSGGTAAAVASNFGAVGLGTDTGNSIRGPSSHQARRARSGFITARTPAPTSRCPRSRR